MKRRPTIWLATLVPAVGFFIITTLRSEESQAKAATPPTAISAEGVFREFRHYRKLTPRVHVTRPEITTRCISPSFERESKPDGLVAHTGIVVYANARAEAAMRTRSGPYPVGSVVVKEKVFARSREALTGQWVTDDTKGIGGMIKREPGYDPDHGDWEYFYTDSSGKLEAGKISSCIECHAIAKPRDHVFGNWLLYAGVSGPTPTNLSASGPASGEGR